jgi:hypothetical protein
MNISALHNVPCNTDWIGVIFECMSSEKTEELISRTLMVTNSQTKGGGSLSQRSILGTEQIISHPIANNHLSLKSYGLTKDNSTNKTLLSFAII